MGVHPAPEICVVECDGRVVGGIERFAPVGNLEEIDLLGVVLGHDNPVFGRQQRPGANGLGNGRQLGRGLMVGFQVGHHFVAALGAIVKHRMLEVGERLDFVEQLLRGERLQLLVGEGVFPDVFRTEGSITVQCAEVSTLIQLGVGACLNHVGFQVFQNRFVGLRIGDELLEKLHGGRHILAQAAQGNIAAVGAGGDAIPAGDVVELLLDLFGALLRSAQVVEVLEREIQDGVGVGARLDDVHQVEQPGGLVLLIEDGDAGLCLELAHVFLEIHEYGLDGFHLRGLNLLQESARGVAVGGDRRDGWLGNLLLVGVFTLVLVDHCHILVAEDAVGEVHDVLLADLAEAGRAVRLRLSSRCR